MESKDKNDWLKAMQEEMFSFQKNQTWKLVQLPEDKKAIGCKWVYRKKEVSSIREPIKYKARLIAKEFAQKKEVDFDEIFSLVVRETLFY